MNSLKYLVKTVKTYPRKYIIDYIAYQAATVFPLFSGLLLSEIFSRLENSQYREIWGIFGLFIGTLLVRITFVLLYSITNAHSRFSTSTLLWYNFIKKLLKMPGAEALNDTHGRVLNCLKEDVAQVEEFVSAFTTEFLSTLFFSVTALIILACTNIKVFIFSFSPVIILFIIIKRIGKSLTVNRKRYRDSVASTSALVGNALKNINQIRILGAEDLVIQQLKKVNQSRLKATIKDSMLRELIICLHKNAINIGTAILMFFYSYLAVKGYFSLKEFSLFIYYMNFISGSIQYLGRIIIEQKATQVSVENLDKISRFIPVQSLFEKDVLSTPVEESTPKEKFSSLEIRDLSYSYPSGEVALNNLNLVINRGDLIVVTGMIASGKTTFLRSVVGLLEQQHGQIQINSRNIAAINILSTDYVSYSPQNPSFFNTTIRDNLFGQSTDLDIEERCLYYAVLDQDISNNQINLDTEIGAEAGKLSGGQRQRLSLARMLQKDADIYVIDDISSALDNNTSQLIGERLLSMKGKTFLIVTEERSYLEKATRIIVLEHGSICFDGTYNEYCDYKNINSDRAIT